MPGRPGSAGALRPTENAMTKPMDPSRSSSTPAPSPPHDDPQTGAQPENHPLRRNTRWTTGGIIFFVLAFALAPLGAIAVGAGVRTIAASDMQREGLLRVSAREKATILDRIITANASRLSSGLARLPASPTPAPDQSTDEPPSPLTGIASDDGRPAQPPPRACAAVDTMFPGNRDVTVQVVDRRTGEDLCVDGVPADGSAIGRPVGAIRIDHAQHRLVHTVAATDSGGIVELAYPLDRLTALLRMDSALPPHRLSLITAGDSIALRDTLQEKLGFLTLSSRAGVGRTGLALEYSAARSWFDGPEIVAMLTPIGMWLLAALLSWLVVDRILLTPIQRLGRRMMQYHPGDRLESGKLSAFAAAEVVTLEYRLQHLTADVATDKQALADGLDRQRALTREVHHRVKNNIQIIASLISLHSRDAPSADATAAYHNIQRRVEALAVVHRHLHADSETGDGIALATMLGELVVSLRNSLSHDQPGAIGVRLTAEPVQVIQDVALPTAFFVVELAELAAAHAPSEPIGITLERREESLARLIVTGAGLAGHLADPSPRYASYQRVLTGLSRQLRQPLDHDDAQGSYCITVPIIG